VIINSITPTSYDGMYKISPDTGPSFYSRNAYLKSITLKDVFAGMEFDENQTEELLDSGLASVVELKAIDYLARAEQSRFGLTRKLLEKKYVKQYIDMALDFLESKNYLSDERFSRAWLHGRQINHYEGRTKLLAELQSRGISKETAVLCVNEFFEENDEFEIACKAWNKFIKKGKQGEKLIAAMINAGFSYKLIKQVQENINPS